MTAGAPSSSLHACALAAAGAAAATGSRPGGDTAQVSMDQAVKMAEQRYHARVVKAEAQRNGAADIYVLRLLR